MGVCCLPKHEISSGVCSTTGMWADFQHCHPKGTKLHKAESSASIKLDNYDKGYVIKVGDLYDHFTLTGTPAQLDSNVLQLSTVNPKT